MRLFKKKQKYGWFKSNKDWSETKKLCTGYDDRRIAESALKKVTDYAPSPNDLLPYAIICQLQAIARDKKELNVVDFGGCFGRLYKQVKPFLPSIKLNWHIVEQKSYVDLCDNSEEIKFYTSIFEIEGKIDVIIASGILQYLDNPDEIIRQFLDVKPTHLIIDRLPVFTKKNIENTITIQKVPVDAYGFDVSYPCWIFGNNNHFARLGQFYEKVSKFYSHQDCRNNIVIDKSGVDFVGYCLKVL